MKYLGLVSLLIMSELAVGQESIITLSSKRNDDKSVEIAYVKPDAGTVTVDIQFNELTNTSRASKNYSVGGYNGNLLTLKPLNKEQHINYSYKYRSIRGKLLPKINTDFVYLLPYPSSTDVRVSEASFLSAKYFGNTEPSDWKVYFFYTKEPTSVTASRKGLVVEVRDTYADSDLNDKTYSSHTNKIIVEHKDGTLLEYDGFQQGSIKVKVGDYVFPGQELGINVKRGENRYAIVYSLYYLKKADLSANENKNISNSESFYGWVTPLFNTAEGIQQVDKDKNYSVLWNDEIIVKEMSKKELNKYNK